MTTPPKLRLQRVWQGQHRGINFKIVSWGFESGFDAQFPSGNWNYYIYIPENRSPRFKQIWLPDRRKSFEPSGRKYISHDYLGSVLGTVEMHGGITFYAKHGTAKDFRCVEIGCDYQHSFDCGMGYDENCVARDAVNTVNDLFERGIIVEESK